MFDSWLGDANVDGQFDSSDLIGTLAALTYEQDVEAVWSSGDFNGSGRYDSLDLIEALADGGYEKGPRTEAVPEPSGMLLLVTAAMGLLRRRSTTT